MMKVAVAMSVMLGLATVAAAQPANADFFGKKTTEFYEAMKKQDAAALGGVFSDDFLYTAASGEVLSKAQYIEALTKLMALQAYSLKPVAVHIYGDATAVAVYRVPVTTRIQGKDYNAALTATDTWVKLSGTWKMVAHHVSPAPGK